MRSCCSIAGFWLVMSAAPSPFAAATVLDSGKDGFTSQVEVVIAAPPEQVYQHLVNDIGKWWEPDHTYSGDSANLYLEATTKGWFGERLPTGGTVQHMEVIAVFPGKLLRLRGALGPLQEFAITGVMTWKLAPTDQGTRLTVVYVVGGYRAGGIAEFAAPVDQVLTIQVQRLKEFVDNGGRMRTLNIEH